MKSRSSRREFLKTTTAAMVLVPRKSAGATAPQVALLPKRRLEKREKWSRS